MVDKPLQGKELTMQRSRYQYLCSEAKAGRDAFVRHPESDEQGILAKCIMQSNHMVVETPEGMTRCWDFHECEDVHHPKSSPMV
jgi:hypothetical protein